MRSETQFAIQTLSAPEYILALHEPEDCVALLLLNRSRGQTLQRIASAASIAAPALQMWLSEQNRAGFDVFVGMNPLRDRATSRTKDSIREIRHVYLDLDEDAEATLAKLRDSREVARPNFVLDTSPARHQVVWKIEGVDLEQAESLLHTLAHYFGGDRAATDATRVLRLPGFVNRKYASETQFFIQAHHESDRVYNLRELTIHDDSSEVDRHLSDSPRPRRSMPAGHKSQSELDWAYAKRALARGDEPEWIIQRIADYRAEDKPDPLYYARHTVEKAGAAFDRIEQQTTSTSRSKLRQRAAAYGIFRSVE